MRYFEFEWDPRKKAQRKHGVTFLEAQDVFDHKNAIRAGNAGLQRVLEIVIRDEYDFKNMKGEQNPYIKPLKKPITIRVDTPTIDYFKSMSENVGMPYQNLINLYLRDCAESKKRLKLKWQA